VRRLLERAARQVLRLEALDAAEHAEALAREIPGARLLALKGLGHQAPPPQDWDTVIPAILLISTEEIRRPGG
jgi:hypothetical protein